MHNPIRCAVVFKPVNSPNIDNTMPTHEDSIIPPEYRGQRLDRVLAALFPQYSRAKLTSWLKQGLIAINQNAYAPDHKVHGGETVSLQSAAETVIDPLQAENIPLHIVYEDESLLIVNKPAGLVVHPGAGNPQHTLMNALLFHEPALAVLPRAGIVHRLDKDTTGLLLVGKTLEAYTDLVRQLQARTIQREYRALVLGHVTGGGTLHTGYGRDPKNRLKMAVLKQGREAITHYTVAQRYSGATLLNVALMTGRTHQIRVHMAHLHHAVVGDPLYARRNHIASGLTIAVREALLGFKRQALHAYCLSLTHPITQAPINCTAPLPDDFQALLTFLEHEHDTPDS